MKVLVVEDETMVSMLVEDMLLDAGHTPVGPAPCVADAMALIGTETFDAALLDINLGGVETALPVADRLDELGIPYALVSGYDPAGIDPKYAHVPKLQKPFSIGAFGITLEKLLARV